MLALVWCKIELHQETSNCSGHNRSREVATKTYVSAATKGAVEFGVLRLRVFHVKKAVGNELLRLFIEI
jgi:hypothetical protein